MPSLRERSIAAGFAGGFFGQKNRNAQTRKTQADRLEQMEKTMELERSKTQYMNQVKRDNERSTFVKSITAAGGANEDGTLNRQGL